MTIRTFLVENGLYQPIDASFLLDQVEDGRITFDAYCPECKSSSTFKRTIAEVKDRVVPISLAGNSPTSRSKRVAGFMPVTMICSRTVAHIIRFEVELSNGKLVKYGQSPSYADILIGSLGTDLKELDKPAQRELVKALRLYSSDAAIGGFVYLRRIFENLISRTKIAHEAEHGLIDGYDALRMKGRIQVLAPSLPALVAENAAVWDILSAGVHELAEADCRRYFPFVQSAIAQILEREAHIRRAREQADTTRKALQAILSEVNGVASPPHDADD